MSNCPMDNIGHTDYQKQNVLDTPEGDKEGVRFDTCLVCGSEMWPCGCPVSRFDQPEHEAELRLHQDGKVEYRRWPED